MIDELDKLRSLIKKYGARGASEKLMRYLRANLLPAMDLSAALHRRKLEEMADDIFAGSYERVILRLGRFGYNVPLFQRPQQLLGAMAKHGALVLYGVTPMSDDVRYMRQVSDNIYLINYRSRVFFDILLRRLDAIDAPKYLDLYSSDWDTSLDTVTTLKKRGFHLIYEYVDALSPQLYGTRAVPKNAARLYEYALSHRDVLITATARSLYDDAAAQRGSEGLLFSPNAADCAFMRDMSKGAALTGEFQSILRSGKPIAMYYGAIAPWLDRELLYSIAQSGRYSVVLIGAKYDGASIEPRENLYILDAVPYSELKYYAAKADVLMIPFIEDDITRSTSPVKLFEYMTLGKPIVSTALPECERYMSVLTAKSGDEFIKLMDAALLLGRSEAYRSLEAKEAEENDWMERARVLSEFLSEHE